MAHRFEKPYLLMLSPLRVAFSTLQNLNKGFAHYEALLANGRMHLEYACSLAEEQMDRGGRVLFEHLWGASSWIEPRLKALRTRAAGMPTSEVRPVFLRAMNGGHDGPGDAGPESNRVFHQR